MNPERFITSPIPPEVTPELERITLNAWQELRGRTKASPIYQKLTRRKYRNPAKFPTWENVALQITAYREFARLVPEQLRDDWTMRSTLAISAMTWEAELPPCYWLSKNLGEALLQTDLPPVSGLRKLLPIGVIMLPPILRNPDGYIVDWVIVAQFEEEEIRDPVDVDGVRLHYKPPTTGDRVAWCHVLPNGNAYAQSIGIYGDSDDPDFGSELNPETTSMVEGLEGEFTRQLGRLVLQCLLVLQARPDLLEEDAPQPVSAAKPHRSHQQREREAPPLLCPRWIGRSFVARSEGKGTHVSPLTHWRRGHWRRVAVGQGRTERRWTWIEPTIVLGGDS